MEELGKVIVPLIMIVIMVVFNLLTKSGKKQRPSPSAPPTPAARDEWEDLLEALGKNNADSDSPESVGYPAGKPPVQIFEPLKPEPVTISASPPLPPLTVSQDEGGEKFVRVSDYQSRSLSDIDHSKFEVTHDVEQKFSDRFSDKESNIAAVPVPTVSANHRTTHPIRAKFQGRQTIREAVIMSEILGAPLALRD